MKPLLVLLVVFVLSVFGIKLFQHTYDLFLAGRIGMAAMLLFSALGHFKFSRGMMMMLPAMIHFKMEIIYFTGILEILGAAGLLINGLHRYTAACLIIFLILILPSNIYAAKHHINLERADYSGKGLMYLWFRIPLQLFFIAWIWYFSFFNH